VQARGLAANVLAGGEKGGRAVPIVDWNTPVPELSIDPDHCAASPRLDGCGPATATDSCLDCCQSRRCPPLPPPPPCGPTGPCWSGLLREGDWEAKCSDGEAAGPPCCELFRLRIPAGVPPVAGLPPSRWICSMVSALSTTATAVGGESLALPLPLPGWFISFAAAAAWFACAATVSSCMCRCCADGELFIRAGAEATGGDIPPRKYRGEVPTAVLGGEVLRVGAAAEGELLSP
jgi:hypothetical protein